MALSIEEEIHQKSFLMREQFDVRNPNAIPRKIDSVFTLTNKLIDLGIRVGIRQKEKLPESMKHCESSYKKAVPAAHGFRKFFTTQLVNLKVNPEIREMLLGHTIGLAGAYYKPTDDGFLENMKSNR